MLTASHRTKLRKRSAYDRTARDWILSLLYANPQKPIHGTLVFVKELFLVEKYIIPETEGKDESFDFYPYDEGPYSTKFARIVTQLVNEGLLEVEGIGGDSTKRVFRLTPLGRTEAEKAFRKIPEIPRQLLKSKRRGWDQLGYYGLLKKVYSEYPEYATKSKIKDQIEQEG